MFMTATPAVHAPALSLPEAAMLPALPKASQPALPRNLLLPDRRTYQPMPLPEQMQAMSGRKGSMAGRAILTYIKNAPAQRPGR